MPAGAAAGDRYAGAADGACSTASAQDAQSGMTDDAAHPERILDAAEDVLRRYGPAKATVVDVARALGVSHGSVYRHFPSKAALRDAVAERWLDRVSTPLDVARRARQAPAPERLRRWLDALIAAKRRKAHGDPETVRDLSWRSPPERARWSPPMSTPWSAS